MNFSKIVDKCILLLKSEDGIPLTPSDIYMCKKCNTFWMAAARATTLGRWMWRTDKALWTE